MDRTIRTCKLALAGGLLLAAFPAEASRAAEASLSRYVHARMADARGEPDQALSAYAEALTANPDNVSVAYRTYRKAVDAGNMVLALRAARTLDRLDALPPDGPLLLFVDQVHRADWRAAERELDRVEASQSFAFMVPALRAWMLFGARKGDALAPLEGRVRDAVGYALVREQRALLLLAQGKAEEGAEAVRSQDRPDVYRSQFRLLAAARLMQLKRADLAATLLDGAALELDLARKMVASGQPLPDAVAQSRSGLSEMLARVSLLLLAERAPQSAAVMARFAAFADSKRAYPTVVTAVALNAVGRNDAALAALSRVRATPLTQGWIDQTRYEALRNGDRPEEALALARDLASRSDVSAESFVRLGDALAATDRHAEAANAFKQAIDLVAARHGETFIPWHYWLQYGRELESARDWTRARQALQRAVEAGPDQATPLNHLGYSMLEHGEDAKAATELIARASAIRPDDAAIIDSLGWAWVRQGDLAKGIPLLEQAAEREPRMGEISEHLGDAYWMSGRRIDARYAWRNALVQSDGDVAERLKAKIDFGLKAAK